MNFTDFIVLLLLEYLDNILTTLINTLMHVELLCIQGINVSTVFNYEVDR